MFVGLAINGTPFASSVRRFDRAEEAEVVRWPRDPRAPRESCRTDHLPRSSADPEPPAARIPHIRAKAPLLLALATKPMRQSRAAAPAEQLARARRVGRDLGVVNRSDYADGIRLVPIPGP